MLRVVLAALALLVASPVFAQPNAQDAFLGLGWQNGPLHGDLGGIAAIDVPAGYQFVGSRSAQKFMELTHNPSDGDEVGVLLHSDRPHWFVVFSFRPEGYVKDDDRKLDADAILKSIRKGTEDANSIRAKRGWSPMEILGWQEAPYYDSHTNNHTWSIRGQSDGGEVINHSTRLLGRRGVMHVDLVLGPQAVDEALPKFNDLVQGFAFNPGGRYAEFTHGDKVAEYGLAGLIVGGTGAALIKTGLLQKFWKLIVVGFLALVSAIRRMFGGGETAPVERPSHV